MIYVDKGSGKKREAGNTPAKGRRGGLRSTVFRREQFYSNPSWMATIIPAPSMAAATASAITTLATAVVAATIHDGDGNGGDDDSPRWQDQADGQRDLYTQIVISMALGLGAFLTFCVSFGKSLFPLLGWRGQG